MRYYIVFSMKNIFLREASRCNIKKKNVFHLWVVSCFTLRLQDSSYFFMLTLYGTLSVYIKIENINFNHSVKNNY